ncbi:MAG TPA: hypothetical protein PKZ69_05170 [Candidatus Cloacimonadota bacterium]|nr:hypothetical protein [Candidatus Cloacimonadota bacterium]HPK40995.1 hypothetical protein [Candidatus Cloacimonadota bacterium]
MKKILFIIIMIFAVALNGISLIAEGKEDQTIKLEDISHLDVVKFNTHRDKRGVVTDDEWEGFSLEEILNFYNVAEYECLEINSDDNYQVKYTLDEVKEFKPILATKRNGKVQKDNNLRIVSETRRDMFWVSDLETIKTVHLVQYPMIKTIYPFSYIQGKIALYDEPKPFTKCKGYYFKDMKEIMVNTVRRPVQLVTKDGFTQELEYHKFVKKAVLIKNDDNSIDIKSPTMPAGMWPKSLRKITFDDTVLLFDDDIEKLDAKQIREIFSLDVDKKITFEYVDKTKKIKKVVIQ